MSPPGTCHDTYDDYALPVRRWQGQDIAHMHLRMCLRYALAINPDMATGCDFGTGATAAAKTGMKQPQVQPLARYYGIRGLCHGGQDRLNRVARAAKGLSARCVWRIAAGRLPLRADALRTSFSRLPFSVSGRKRIITGAGGP